MATVEAMEAATALYAYECAHVAAYSATFSSYYDAQLRADGFLPAQPYAAYGEGATAVGGKYGGSASPTHPVGTASEVFTASSEASAEEMAGRCVVGAPSSVDGGDYARNARGSGSA
eukprot:364745-Chlamydomonas_euryale.AAC.12